MKKRFLSIVGTRPQFIKAALLSRELRKDSDEVLVHTGQHYDIELSDYFFEALDIPRPDHNLGVGSFSHAKQTGEMLVALENVIQKEKPDSILTYGDTNSTLAGALAAVKLGVSIAHVEAGLRSYNRSMPEEINRVLTDHVSELLFCPTKASVANLEREGITEGVHLVGDVMYDLALNYKAIAWERRTHEGIGVRTNEYILVTIHRPSNTDNKANLSSIVDALVDCGSPVVFPAHPRVERYLREFDLHDKLSSKVKVLKPQDYIDFASLLHNCKKVVTDSGGIQKEAYFSAKPCITLRAETEWVETVEDGWNVLVGTDTKKIVQAIQGFEPKGKRSNHYGDGKAVERIREILLG
jgi:UDP-N-acetylglucosamine 2-epimerase (non-hydrolysing)